MSSVVKTVFGGTDKSAQKAQIKANESAQEFIKQQGEQARQDVVPLFGEAQQVQTAGAQQALGVLGQTAPAQIEAFQAGNIGAQQQLLAGLGAQQAAILGTPMDLSGLQPTQINASTAFLQQELPSIQAARVQNAIRSPSVWNRFQNVMSSAPQISPQVQLAGAAIPGVSVPAQQMTTVGIPGAPRVPIVGV